MAQLAGGEGDLPCPFFFFFFHVRFNPLRETIFTEQNNAVLPEIDFYEQKE